MQNCCIFRKDSLMTSAHPRKQFVLDTNVLIHDPSSLFKFKEHDVVLTMTVLEELDHIKDSTKGNHQQVNREARLAIQHIDKIVNGHSSEEIKAGIPIGEGLGLLKIVTDPSASTYAGRSGELDLTVPDNRIINSALTLTSESKEVSTVLVTKDINMRLKAKSSGVFYVEDYKNDQVLSDIDYLSAGYLAIDSSSFPDSLQYKEQQGDGKFSFTVPKSNLPDEIQKHIEPNFAFIDGESIWIVRKIDDDLITMECKKADSLMKMNAFGVKPRNIEQALAMYAAMSRDIDVVFLTGPAGTGKTLIALASAFEMVVEQKRFDKIIVTRSVTDIDEPIGFLPGTEEDKMKPWLAAFTDSMEVFSKDFGSGSEGKMNSKDAAATTLDLLQQKANLQFKSINFMRGRSIGNACVILDECQNLSAHQMKTMLTRLGENSKMLCLGNLQQIDSRFLTALTSGLTVSVEKFRAFERSATVMLKGGVRSPVATYAEDVF